MLNATSDASKMTPHQKIEKTYYWISQMFSVQWVYFSLSNFHRRDLTN